MSKEWATNITVRTQISAFLAGTFFAVLLVFVTQQDIQQGLFRVDLSSLTIVSLTVTFTAFAFSTFALGLSADCFRKCADEKAETVIWEKRAKTAFTVGGSFFKCGYIMMIPDLFFVIAYADWRFGLVGAFIFVAAWIFLILKTGFPYDRKR